MARYILSPKALGDLDIIWGYVAQDDIEAADRIVDAAYRVCRNLAQHPELGPVHRVSRQAFAIL